VLFPSAKYSSQHPVLNHPQSTSFFWGRKLRFTNGKMLLDPRSTRKLENYSLTTARDCLFTIIADTYLDFASAICNPRTCHIMTSFWKKYIKRYYFWCNINKLEVSCEPIHFKLLARRHKLPLNENRGIWNWLRKIYIFLEMKPSFICSRNVKRHQPSS
jgi:hypothetical protein